MNSAPYSILFGRSRPAEVEQTPEPDYFVDLHLDQVVATVVGEGDPFKLTPLFRYAIADPETWQLRQDVFDDIAQTSVRSALEDFVREISAVYSALRGSASVYAGNQKMRMHLNGAVQYCRAVREFAVALGSAGIRSAGLGTIVTELRALSRSADFQALEAEANEILEDLRSLRYEVYLEGGHVTVGPEADDSDYSSHLIGLFSRFRQTTGPRPPDPELEKRHRIRQLSGDSVRDRIVSLVAELHPGPFRRLNAFFHQWESFLDQVVELFYREVQFYLRYADVTKRLAAEGLSTTRPVLRDGLGFDVQNIYDIALALRGAPPHLVTGLVTNDLDFSPEERRVVITGPNQGGKTTLSRAIGQLHHLAVIGCPVPASHAHLSPSDRIFTHFERAEVGHLTGKLEDDLLRIQLILASATSHSVVILNEIFASTTTADAARLATIVLDRLLEAGALCVCVTFLDEVAHLPGAVSLVAQVEQFDLTDRTFQVLRAPANGRAYAAALAAKHHLAYADIKGRVR